MAIKTILIFLLAAMYNCCWGQYPEPRTPSDYIVENRKPFIGEAIPINEFTYKDTVEVISDSAAFELLKDGQKPYPVYNPITKKTVWCIKYVLIRMPLYLDTTSVPGKRVITTIPQSTGAIQFDSSLIYYQQFNKYQRLMNEELEKLNRLQNPQMTRKVFRYQDSCKRYQELLNKLKK